MPLELIIGCMFSGKTTELHRRAMRHRAIGRRVLVATPDTRATRRAAETTIASVEDIDFARYDVVALDEAQFVDVLGLVPHLETTLCIVAGLNGSFQRKPFGNLLQLVPHADDVVFCKALCARCRDGTPATFSKRLGASTALVDVGDHYAPVCRKCF